MSESVTNAKPRKQDATLDHVDVWGSYQSCTLYIRASSLVDLSPEHGEPTPRAISTHAHEYVHYLHSLGTAAGQTYLLYNLLLLRSLVSGTDSNGHFIGMDAVEKEHRDLAEATLSGMQGLRGQRNTKFKGSGLHTWNFGPPRLSGARDSPLGMIRLIISASAKTPDGTPISDDFDVGYSFITEGVAHEVDHGIRSLQGIEDNVALDSGTNSFPYFAYGELIDYWVGRKTTRDERILIGNAALTKVDVGQQLLLACKAVRDSTKPAFEALKPKFELERELSSRILAELRSVVDSAGAGPTVMAGLKTYLALVERAMVCRSHLVAPERLFLEKPLDVKSFLMVIGNLVDTFVLQEKPAGESEISWIGPNLVVRDEDGASQIATVQAAFHFNHLHHRQDGKMASTNSLGKMTCPYKGACRVDVPESSQELCSSAPWKMFLDSIPGSQVCWYAAGVKTVRRIEGLSAVD